MARPVPGGSAVMPVIEPHAPLPGPSGEPCTVCGEPLAADQRYCLNCGERRGPPRLDPLAPARGREPALDATPIPARTAAPWPLPTPRVGGVATMLVLGFGIVAGAAAGPRSDLAPAATARRVVVVAQAPAPAPAAQPAAAKPKPRPKPKPAPAAQPTVADSSTPPAAPDTSAPAPSTPAARKNDTTPTTGGGDTSTPTVANIKHVWLVALTGHTMDEALAAPSPMPYLSGTLRPKGLLLSNYNVKGPFALANLIALVSGQKTTADQQAGCPAYSDVDPKAKTGCVFAKDVDTLPGQLTAVGRTWHAYVEDSDAGQPPDTCRHPAPGAALEPVMSHDPYLFFHSIVDGTDCGANIAGISRLAPDSADAESAPTMSLVIPNACHDGLDQPCTDGAPAGLGAADAWLKAQLDPLLASKAYADHGLVIVTFDAGPDPAKPVGALLLSPAVKAGDTDDAKYGPAQLLRTLEDLFSLDPLGVAKDAKALPITKASP
jgi:phosphatidylinositol-3-phosphatase